MNSHCPILLLFLQTAIPFLVGTKYDMFAMLGKEEQEEITKQVCKKERVAVIFDY